MTPAIRHSDGLDYAPTNRNVRSPVRPADRSGLVAQIGYPPGLVWILSGVVIAGAVRDMTVLFPSEPACQPVDISAFAEDPEQGIVDHPLASVLGALVLGILIGKLTRR